MNDHRSTEATANPALRPLADLYPGDAAKALAAAYKIEVRITATVTERFNALIKGTVGRKDEAQLRIDVDQIVREVVEAELEPLPFKVQTVIEPDSLLVNFAYPLPLP